MQLINLLFLMWIVLMPFSTALVGEYEHQQLPVIIYAVHNILTSLTLTWLWRHAASDSSLVEANLDPRLVRHSTFRALIVQGVFLLSIGISFISVDVARLSWVLMWPLTGPVLQRYGCARTKGPGHSSYVPVLSPSFREDLFSVSR